MIKLILKKTIEVLLKWEAVLILKKYKPRIVGVTGTVGKTSTKDAIALVMSLEFKVRKNEKSYNNEIGVPLTIIGVQSASGNPFAWLGILWQGLKVIIKKVAYPEWLVLEMGVDRPGDMEKMISWIKPDVVVATMIGETPVHVEFFKTPDELLKEKMKLAKVVGEHGYIVLNGDDEDLLEYKDKFKARVLTYGFSKENDLIASNYALTIEGISFKVDYKGIIVPIRLKNIFGEQNVYTALAALTVGLSQGLNFVEMAEKLQEYKAPPGRLNLLEGIKNTKILDDSYNSSPIAVLAGLEVLQMLPGKRKIAVLGDMLELGKFTIVEHRKIGSQLRKSGVDILFAVGPRSKFIAEAARENRMSEKKIFEFSCSYEACQTLQETIKEGDLILIKGSQGMRMEKITEEIMAYPELKADLLVRQEKEWEGR